MGILDPGIQMATTTQNASSTTSGAPQFIQQHQADVLNLGRQGAVEGGVAGLTGDEQAAADLARQQTGNWVPGLSAAMQLATTAGTAGAHAGMKNYTNPWEDQVVAGAQRAGQQGLDRLQQGAMLGGLGTGSFGDSRSARAAAQGVAQGSSDLADKIASIRSQGFNTALGASQQDLNRALQASGQLSGDAARAQQLGQADVGTLGTIGAKERDINQRGLDYKLNTAKQLADLGNQAKAAYGQTTTNQSSTTSPFKSTDSKLDQLLGGGTALMQLLGGFGGGGGGGGGGNVLGSLIGGAKNLFSGFGGSGSYANPYDGGWGDSSSGWEGSDAWNNGWGDWADGGSIMRAEDRMRLASGGMPPQPLEPEMKKSMILANPQAQGLADGGQPIGEDMDPMQALDALAQAGVPPELLQQIEQALGGGGMPQGGGAPGGMPPQGGMARGGLACMADGGSSGGAYGISPEVIARLKAASSQGQFGNRDTMGMVSGARTSNMGSDPRTSNNVVHERDRRNAMFTQKAHGGLAHMADGGGAYGIDPALIARLKAASSPNQFGSRDTMGMIPGASTVNAGSSVQDMQRERRMREAQLANKQHGYFKQ